MQIPSNIFLGNLLIGNESATLSLLLKHGRLW